MDNLLSAFARIPLGALLAIFLFALVVVVCYIISSCQLIFASKRHGDTVFFVAGLIIAVMLFIPALNSVAWPALIIGRIVFNIRHRERWKSFIIWTILIPVLAIIAVMLSYVFMIMPIVGSIITAL